MSESKPNHTIRPVQQSDNAELASLIRAVFVEYGAPKIGTVYSDPTTDDLYGLFAGVDGAQLWVAEEDGQLIGCCGLYPTQGLPDGHVELVKFYMSNKGRGRGIGKKLMHKSLNAARTLGYSHVYLESTPEYAQAVGMYERIGFKHLPGALGASGHDGCTIWMLLDLSKS